ncbi:hypothetical protein DFH07DRAFT_957246 [Mycena maculata]|uniref:Uncharacterized protein n=1 Tax=Mycena maculata TaxID=230809 RepID=A0AAD7NHP7_9AGAR|nr:hypothetical protein DFH07DRAFT_957246 [Mycena maculata]
MPPPRTIPPTVDDSDPESIRRYNKWYSSFLYNDRRNDLKRERMRTLRLEQALDSPKVQAARLEAKRASAAKYREKHRERLAMLAKNRRNVRKYRKKANELKAQRRARLEDKALEAAIVDLEPMESEEEGSNST